MHLDVFFLFEIIGTTFVLKSCCEHSVEIEYSKVTETAPVNETQQFVLHILELVRGVIL